MKKGLFPALNFTTSKQPFEHERYYRQDHRSCSSFCNHLYHGGIREACAEDITTRNPYIEAEDKAHLRTLQEMNTSSKTWSGTSERFDIKYKSLSPRAGQLCDRAPLGEGRNGEVYRDVCHGIPMAPKPVKASSANALAALEADVATIS